MCSYSAFDVLILFSVLTIYSYTCLNVLVQSLERDCRREDAVAYAEFMAHYYKDMLAWNDRHDVTARILDIVIRWSRHGGGAVSHDLPTG